MLISIEGTLFFAKKYLKKPTGLLEHCRVGKSDIFCIFQGVSF